jgi:hypothetical protein
VKQNSAPVKLDPLTFLLVCCAGVSGAAIASVFRGVSLAPIGLSGIAAALIASPCARAITKHGPSRRAVLDWAVLSLSLVFLVPLFTMPVAPGADMAMHTAFARALVDGSTNLSPSMGAVGVPIYPRGLSAMVALASPILGFAKSGLWASNLSYLIVVAGVIAFFRLGLRLSNPVLLAVVTVLACDTPQRFFGWAGNPTAMAFGLALMATATIAHGWDVEEGIGKSALLASILGLGALAVHPAGAISGLLGLIFALALRARRTSSPPLFTWRSVLATTGVLTVIATGMMVLKVGGPRLSPAELSWITAYQDGVERILPAPDLYFAFQIWSALPRVLGPPWVIACGLAVLVLLFSKEYIRVLACLAAVVAIAAILVAGPHIPFIGVLFYPVRFTPLLALATAPLLAWAVEALGESRAWLPPVCGLLLIAVGLKRNFHSYQRVEPIATFNDIEAIACLDAALPRTAIIDGAYGDATQWTPALTGRAASQPHVHISLNDEFQAQLKNQPPASFLFVGERLRYGSPSSRVAPASDPVCRAGKAALYRIEPEK